MSNSTDDPSVETFLTFISEYVVDHFKKTGRRTDGAALAEAIRTKFPGFKYEQVGLSRLSDAVRCAEEQGLVVRHHDVKHLELSPGSSSGLSVDSRVSDRDLATLPHVKPEVWRAFVFVSRAANRCFDRETSQVVVIDESNPLRQDLPKREERYVKITPIPDSTQQEWMETFVGDREWLTADESPIRVEEWWLRFPEWLRSLDRGLDREWNRIRTQKVLDHIRKWASDNHILVERLLSPPLRILKHRAQSICRHGSLSEVDALRSAVLAAVGEMPLEDLENLALPVRYILRHFQPRN